MGNLRLQTVVRLLTCSPDLRGAVLHDFAVDKTAQQCSKHVEASTRDIFEKCKPHAEGLLKQEAVARLFMSPSMQGKIADQSPEGAARASEDMAHMLKAATILQRTPSLSQKFSAYKRLLNVFTRSHEPLVKNTVVVIFMTIYNDTPERFLQTHLFVPLAIAIGSRFDGYPTDSHYRKNVEDFVATNFLPEMRVIAQGVIKEHNLFRRKETTKLMRKLVGSKLT